MVRADSILLRGLFSILRRVPRRFRRRLRSSVYNFLSIILEGRSQVGVVQRVSTSVCEEVLGLEMNALTKLAPDGLLVLLCRVLHQSLRASLVPEVSHEAFVLVVFQVVGVQQVGLLYLEIDEALEAAGAVLYVSRYFDRVDVAVVVLSLVALWRGHPSLFGAGGVRALIQEGIDFVPICYFQDVIFCHLDQSQLCICDYVLSYHSRLEAGQAAGEQLGSAVGALALLYQRQVVLEANFQSISLTHDVQDVLVVNMVHDSVPLGVFHDLYTLDIDDEQYVVVGNLTPKVSEQIWL